MKLKSFKPNSLELSADIKKQGSKIILTYTIEGSCPNLAWSKPNKNPVRRDGIWKRTCLELFLSGKNKEKYIELNFCPSGDWACYLFNGYRGTPSNPQVSRPIIEQVNHAVLTVNLDWQEINFLLGEHKQLEGSLTACLLEDNKQSFWAYKHPEPKADFHDRSCFITLDLGN